MKLSRLEMDVDLFWTTLCIVSKDSFYCIFSKEPPLKFIDTLIYMDVHLSKKLWAANQMKTKGSNKPHQTMNTNILKLIKTAKPLTAFN